MTGKNKKMNYPVFKAIRLSENQAKKWNTALIRKFLDNETVYNTEVNQNESKEVKKSKSCYEILGVNRKSTEQEIKIAYKRLAKKYHPDYNKSPNAKEQFIELNNAYTELTNQEPPTIADLMNAIFGSLSGNRFWEETINYEDFNINRQVAFLGRYIDNLSKEEEENYKKYRWTKNKMKLLNKVYRDFISQLTRYNEEINAEHNREVLIETIKHLNKVLNKESIDRTPKKYVNPLSEPIFDSKIPYNPIRYEGNKQYYNYTKEYDKRYNKYKGAKLFIEKSYKIRNQFHPKFLDHLPMKAQIFINNKIREMIIRLEKGIRKG